MIIEIMKLQLTSVANRMLMSDELMIARQSERDKCEQEEKTHM